MERHNERLVRWLIAAQAIAFLAACGALAYLARRYRARSTDVADLTQLALVDSLTGLRNRRAFDEELTRALDMRARGPVRPRLALAMIDMRGLKALNDSLGHQIGDDRLVALAQVLRSNVRGGDSVYRLGGDEFMVILPGQGAHEARRLVGRVSVSLAEHGIAIAVGIAEASATVSTDALIGRADRALIAAKRGPDNIVVWQPTLDTSPAILDPVDQDAGDFS
jgi:diguanylate cyclase (GGDEF)-like protein